MDINTKNLTTISDFDQDVNSFEFSKTGKRILFTADVKLDQTPQDIYTDLPKTNVIIAEDLMYRHWNAWTDYNYSHIFVADLQDNKYSNPTDIMDNEKFDAPLAPYFDATEIAWSPDENTIAYTCKKLAGKEYAISTNSDIYLYDCNTKITKNITETMMGYDKYPIFSPDGTQIAWTSMETPGYEADKNCLFIMNLSTNEKIYLTENFDFNANTPLWNEDNPVLIRFTSEINGTVQVFEIDINTKEIKQISSGWHDYTQIYNAENGNIIGTKMSIKMASEVFKLNTDGSETQISYTNQHIYDKIRTCDVQQRWITTTDKKQMHTWIITPPDFDSTKIYPAILFCEGGPQSQVSQFWSFRWNFQMMASNGYVVVAPNRRGLPGFGTEWNAQISGDYGGQNMKDYISAITNVMQEPYINKDKIGAVGASYGGFSVYWLAGHNENKLFKAFIAHCGMFNFESQYGGTEEMFFVNHDLGGPYWDKNNKTAQKSYDNSPHRFIQNWNTPILIITGMKDFRIPYTESLQAFNSAKMLGIDAKLLVFPEETHFVLKPQNSVLWQREFKAWLDKYLK
jgi:dipeptidyl aminopeptidase/acylaminoacyl peptidase